VFATDLGLAMKAKTIQEKKVVSQFQMKVCLKPRVPMAEHYDG
jgi:hypothetical protein